MSQNSNDEVSDTDVIGSPKSDIVYGALMSEEIERVARDTRLDFFDFDKVTGPCTDKNGRAPNLDDEGSETDAISSPKSDIVYGALISEQIERAARDTRLDFFDFDKVTGPCTDKNDRASNPNDEANPTVVIEIQEADIMLERSISEQIDRAAREAGLDVYDYDKELAAGSDKSGKGNSREDNGDNGGNDESLNVFEDMDSVHSDDMFGGFDQTTEEQIENAVRQQRLKRHSEDKDTHAAMQVQAMIEQQEREEGARAKKRQGAEIEEAAAAAVLPSELTLQPEQFKIMPEPIRDSIQDTDAAEKIEKSGQEQKQEQGTVQPSQHTQQAAVAEETVTSNQEREQQQNTIQSSQEKWQADVTEEILTPDKKQKQRQIAMQPPQQANVSTTQVEKARRTRPKIERRRYLEQIQTGWEDMLAWTESTTVQWTRHRNNGKR
jgi:hypothetical protein